VMSKASSGVRTAHPSQRHESCRSQIDLFARRACPEQLSPLPCFPLTENLPRTLEKELRTRIGTRLPSRVRLRPMHVSCRKALWSRSLRRPGAENSAPWQSTAMPMSAIDVAVTSSVILIWSEPSSRSIGRESVHDASNVSALRTPNIDQKSAPDNLRSTGRWESGQVKCH
jgi:hypothetical protein